MRTLFRYCLVVLLGIAAIDAGACSCPARESWWDSKYPIVFRARVLATELTKEKYEELSVVTARFEVTERFRGDPSIIKALRTTNGTRYGTCGIALTAGDEFIIHTGPEGWATECTGTQSYHEKRDESLLEKLREARDKKK